MAFQQSDLTTIEEKIASGVLRMKYADGREAQFQSLDHMLKARDVIRADLTVQANAMRGATSRKFAQFRSGF